MAYDPGAIDTNLAAAVGDSPSLIAELRESFLDSARRALAQLQTAKSDQDWQAGTHRLKGLAASFGAVRLMALADTASKAACGDAAIIQKIRRAIDRL